MLTTDNNAHDDPPSCNFVGLASQEMHPVSPGLSIHTNGALFGVSLENGYGGIIFVTDDSM
jgi:hypothetical protein